MCATTSFKFTYELVRDGIVFGKHVPQLSEIFWEGVEEVMSKRGHFITASISNPSFLENRLELYANSIFEKGGALKSCVGFIDGTVIGIARPSPTYMQQLVAYDGHKRKHGLKYQVISAPDGLILHCFGPMEGRRHDWTLYVESGVEEELQSALNFGGKKYCIYGDSGYNNRWYLCIPFQGSNLNSSQLAFNKAMSRLRIPVEWLFKEVKQYFPLMDFARKLKVNQAPVGSLYLLSVLLTNFRACVYRNSLSIYFNCAPPSLEEYLSYLI